MPALNQMKVFHPNSLSGWAGYGLGIHHAYAYASSSMLGHDGYYTNMTDMFHSYDFDFTLVTMTNTQTQWFAFFNQMYPVIKKYITTLGIEKNTASHAIHLFPNPASEHITISFSDSGPAEIHAFRITNTLGQIVRQENFEGIRSSVDIKVSDLSPGLYQIYFKSQYGTVTTKFVKTN